MFIPDDKTGWTIALTVIAVLVLYTVMRTPVDVTPKKSTIAEVKERILERCKKVGGDKIKRKWTDWDSYSCIRVGGINKTYETYVIKPEIGGHTFTIQKSLTGKIHKLVTDPLRDKENRDGKSLESKLQKELEKDGQ